MKITIFGLAGTGKSTLGKKISEILKYDFFSTGNLMRENARQLKMTIYDFELECKKNPKYDIELDKKIENLGKQRNNFVVESRLAWYFIPDSIKICLKCDKDVTIERISKRENISITEANNKTIKRAKDLEYRYAKSYPQISFPPKDSEFDLILDTTKGAIGELVEKIMEFLDKKNR